MEGVDGDDVGDEDGGTGSVRDEDGGFSSRTATVSLPLAVACF